MSLPFVSCVCVTGKSPVHLERFLPIAIECFQRQRYPIERRELLLVSDGDPGYDVAVWPESQVRWIHAPKSSLGALRNLGIDAAKGDLVCQWDDDDVHHPDRIRLQVAACQAAPGCASFLMRQLCWSMSTNTAFVREYTNTPIHGTIMHPRDPQVHYPEKAKEEDSDFFAQWAHRAVAIDNDPALYVRLEHGGNTWDADHILMGYSGEWAKGRWHLCDEHRAFLQREVVPRYQQQVPPSAFYLTSHTIQESTV